MTNKEFFHYLNTEVYGINKVSLLRMPYHIWYNTFIDLEHSFLFHLRLMQRWGTSKSKIGRLLGSIVQKRILSRYGCCTHPFSKIGIGFHVPHPTGIVIGRDVVIGEYCTLYQNVTLGSKVDAGHDVAPQPILGNKVMIYANSLVLGGVFVQDGTIVGAHSMVLEDTDVNGVYVGVPAKKKR